MSASACFCGAATFADFDSCFNHVPRVALVCEVLRLRWKLSVTAAPERPRHENDSPPSCRRPETTILERM